MIIVLGLSPAVDITYGVSQLIPGNTNRVTSIAKKAGGKSINLARVARTLGGAPHLVIPLGGETGRWISSELRRQGLDFDEIVIAQETRQSITVFDGEATVFNEPASSLGEHDLAGIETSLIAAFDKLTPANPSVFAISGSVPDSVPASYLPSLIGQAEKRGVRSFVDVSGPHLLLAAAARPFLLKPNLDELMEALPSSSMENSVRKLQDLGARNVLVTDGPNGLTWFDENGTKTQAKSIAGVRGNPTGAGDALLAALCVAFESGKTINDALLDGLASGAAAVLSAVAGEIDLQAFDKFRETAILDK